MINETDIQAMQEDLDYIDSWNAFDGYQNFSQKTAIFPPDKALEYTSLGLAGEAGELANKVAKYIRDGTTFPSEDAAKELGDVLWFVAQASMALGYPLSEIARMNVDKLLDRKERGVIGGSGDNR